MNAGQPAGSTITKSKKICPHCHNYVFTLSPPIDQYDKLCPWCSTVIAILEESHDGEDVVLIRCPIHLDDLNPDAMRLLKEEGFVASIDTERKGSPKI